MLFMLVVTSRDLYLKVCCLGFLADEGTVTPNFMRSKIHRGPFISRLHYLQVKHVI